MEGWIKLYRKLIENPIFLKPELLQLFIYCLLKANHETQRIIFNGQEIEIKPGQFITGRNAMAKDLKQNPITTYKRLKVLENLQILNIESNNRFSVVTIIKWELYQSEEIKSNTKRNNKGTTREQQGNTNKNVKNDKNVKKLKKEINKEKKPVEKIFYAEFVSMTNDEYSSLVAKVGEDGTKRCIEILDNYKGSTGKKYKSDYRTILNWVVQRYEEEKNRKPQNKSQGGNIFLEEDV